MVAIVVGPAMKRDSSQKRVPNVVTGVVVRGGVTETFCSSACPLARFDYGDPLPTEECLLFTEIRNVHRVELHLDIPLL